MKTKIRVISTAASIISAIAFSTLSAHAIALVDPGFEAGVGWNTFNGAAYQFNPAFARTGNGSMKDVTQNNVPGRFEDLPAPPRHLWTLSGYGMTPDALPGRPCGRVSFCI